MLAVITVTWLPLDLVGVGELDEGLPGQQRDVAHRHEDGPAEIGRQGLQPALDGPTGAGDVVLVGDDEVGVDRLAVGDDLVAPVPDHDGEVGGGGVPSGPDRVSQQLPPGDAVEHLRGAGLHPRPLACGEDDDGGRATGHAGGSRGRRARLANGAMLPTRARDPCASATGRSRRGLTAGWSRRRWVALGPMSGPRAAGPDHGPVPDVEGYDVVVLDGASRQSVAAVRSLGRAGLRVAVGECFAECEPSLPVAGFRSRYCARRVVLPSFAEDPTGFATELVRFVRENPTPVVLPASDGAVAALLPFREQLGAMGSVLALPSTTALRMANDKSRTLSAAARLGIDHPRTMTVTDLNELPDVLAHFEFPVVIKPTTSWPSRTDGRVNPRSVLSFEEAHAAVASLLDQGAGVLVEHLVCGRREGVTVFLSNGEVKASFAHFEHRTMPLLGGVSVLRESIPVPPDLLDLSARLGRDMGLDGLFEVEFRRDASGLPYLMEVNARLAGPTEIALRCGIDFPLMLWRWAVGAQLPRQPRARTGSGRAGSGEISAGCGRTTVRRGDQAGSQGRGRCGCSRPNPPNDALRLFRCA